MIQSNMDAFEMMVGNDDLPNVLTLVLLPALTGVIDGDLPNDVDKGNILAGAWNHDRKGRLVHWTNACRRRAIFSVAFIAGRKNRLARIVHSRSDRARPRRGVRFCEPFGVSFALGAFFAGVVVNASDLSHRAARDLQPLQDAFTVLFFVAVGMLFDPSILTRQPLPVLAVLAIVVFGKSLAALGIVRVLGGSTRTALIVFRLRSLRSVNFRLSLPAWG